MLNSGNSETEQIFRQMQEQMQELREEVKRLQAENNKLKNQSGIRRFMVLSQSQTIGENMDTTTDTQASQPVNSRKPPPFYVSGTKSLPNSSSTNLLNTPLSNKSNTNLQAGNLYR
jgi:TolA-binding protein